MNDWLKHVPIEPIQFIYGVIAVTGGVARYLNSYVDGTPFKFSIFLASAFVAGFSGYMFTLLGTTMNVPAPMLSILAGTGGFFGSQTMKLVLEAVSNRIK